MSDDNQGDANHRDAPEKAADRKPVAPDGKSNVIDFKSIQPAAGYATLPELQAAVERLAALPELVYAQVRKDEAKLLGITPISALDKAVKQARPKDADDGRQGGRVVLPETEPWPDPVDGEALVTELVEQLKRFLVTRDDHLVAAALWILHTHAFGAWWVSPKLLIKSATKRCGKTRVFETIERVVARRLLVSAATCSAVFRVIAANADAPPTLLMDEADRLTQSDDAMRKLINAGHTRSAAHVMVSDPGGGNDWMPRQFSTWAPVALAGIGDQADTIQDRSIIVRMKRKTKAQQVEKLRGNKDYGFHELARKAARWAADHVEALRDAEPEMPELLNDRAQDSWEPLIAIADAVGGEWPKRARACAISIQRENEEFDEEEVGVQLLHDIGDVFEDLSDHPPGGNIRGYMINQHEWSEVAPARRATTAYVLARLHGMEERYWSTYGKAGTPLRAHELAGLLRQFEITSRQLKFTIDGKGYNWAGYEQAQFIQHMARYPRKGPTCLPCAETADLLPNGGVEKTEVSFGGKPAETAEGRQAGPKNGVRRDVTFFDPPERLCAYCGEPLSILARANRMYCSDSCSTRATRKTAGSTGGRQGGRGATENTPDQKTTSKPLGGIMITHAMKAQLRKLGVHGGVIHELRPEDARRMLDAPETVCANARRSPEQDLRELAASLADLDSMRIASEARQYIKGIEITPAMIDAIKIGDSEAMYAIRDAIWTALS